ncbi:hypothetical protein [Vineibacter terrae]|uniref:hypothetical protein n=1 Tax=Vineibacter terrae TaxID=2586908 RepID=UPI002E36CFA8|nr:hypothetical protein [Vineibacter terrae]HEX2891840.1 hypothetical protein [Vineibacter terrae]
MRSKPGGAPRAGRAACRSPDAGGDVRALALRHVEAAIAALVDVMANPDSPAGARISAAESILNRACGRPGSVATASMPDDFADVLTAAAAIRAARSGAAAGHAAGCAAPADGGLGDPAASLRQ